MSCATVTVFFCYVLELSEEMCQDGFKTQVNIDTSKVAIDIMSELYKGKPSMECKVLLVSLNRFALCVIFMFIMYGIYTNCFRSFISCFTFRSPDQCFYWVT